MRISQNLPQFDEEEAIIIVSGAQAAKIYRAYRGTIAEQVSIHIPTPKYSDREGFFVRSGKGRRFGSGSVYEPVKKMARADFLKELEGRVQSIFTADTKHVYLFSPRHMTKAIEKVLPAQARERIRYTFGGNYGHAHPFQLLKEIEGKRAGRIALVGEEARKILQKTKRVKRKKKK